MREKATINEKSINEFCESRYQTMELLNLGIENNYKRKVINTKKFN